MSEKFSRRRQKFLRQENMRQVTWITSQGLFKFQFSRVGKILQIK
jgi:hypothetical protein